MKSNSFVFVAGSMILVAAVIVGFLVARPFEMQQTRTPVFMGTEVRVSEVAAPRQARGRAEAKVVPVPQPKVSAPLPIVPPQVMSKVMPTYPQGALEQGLTGTALLSVYVGLTGNAEKVQLKSSSGVSALDQSAVAAVSQWTFVAARLGGAAIASWFEIPVRFEVK